MLSQLYRKINVVNLRKLTTNINSNTINECISNQNNKKTIFNSNTINKCICNQNNKKTILNYSIGFFLIGGCVEAYTFSKTNNLRESTGLGWSIFAILLISGL